MSITKILSEKSAETPQKRGKTAQQAAYRSRFPRKVAALLERQAKGRYLNNRQKRLITRHQRQQLHLRAIGGAV